MVEEGKGSQALGVDGGETKGRAPDVQFHGHDGRRAYGKVLEQEAGIQEGTDGRTAFTSKAW